ncbi:hypothetical protein TNCV_3726251 [Trichonephila clavipes]|nr:hypothetical protein TNCV_3726251 [Trichonephila clavipes]
MERKPELNLFKRGNMFGCDRNEESDSGISALPGTSLSAGHDTTMKWKRADVVIMHPQLRASDCNANTRATKPKPQILSLHGKGAACNVKRHLQWFSRALSNNVMYLGATNQDILHSNSIVENGM